MKFWPACLHRIAILAVLLPHPLPAQAPANQIPQLGERIEVSIIDVDVFVTDRQGKRVHGLTRDDFLVLEDGKPRAITNFTEYATDTVATEGVETPTSATVAPRQPRTVVVFIDRYAARSDVQQPVYDRIKTFLRDVMEEGDRASVVTWDTSMRVRQELTSDRAQLDQAIDRAAEETSSLQHDVEDRVKVQAWFHNKPILGAGGPNPLPMPPIVTGDYEALERIRDIKGKSAALESLITSMAGVKGRKIILFATRNYHWNPNAGLGLGNAKAHASMSTDIPRNALIRTANAHGVTIYPIYPVGRIDRTNSAEDSLGRSPTRIETPGQELAIGAIDGAPTRPWDPPMRALDEIAKETGGAMAYGAGDLPSLLPTIRRDLGSYYSIAYRDESGRADRTRSLEVRVKNKPDYLVRHRRQAVNKSPATRMKDLVRAQLFVRNTEPMRLPISAQAGNIAKRGRNRSLVPLLIRVPGSGLTFLPDGEKHVGGFSIFVVAGSSLGTEGDVVQKTQALSFTNEQLARAKQTAIGYSVDLEIDSSTDRVAIGVLDEISQEQGLTSITLKR